MCVISFHWLKFMKPMHSLWYVLDTSADNIKAFVTFLLILTLLLFYICDLTSVHNLLFSSLSPYSLFISMLPPPPTSPLPSFPFKNFSAAFKFIIHNSTISFLICMLGLDKRSMKSTFFSCGISTLYATWLQIEKSACFLTWPRYYSQHVVVCNILFWISQLPSFLMRQVNS